MSDPSGARAPEPRRFIQEVLRQDRAATFQMVATAWRRQHGEVDLPALRAAYEAELEERRAESAEDSRTVVRIARNWTGIHLLAWAAMFLVTLLTCGRNDCDLEIGLLSLLIGIAQLIYGVIAAVINAFSRRPVAQGILIGSALTALLLTVLCFGVLRAKNL